MRTIADLVWRLTHRRLARRLDELKPRTSRTVYVPMATITPRFVMDEDPPIGRFGEW